MKSTRSRLRARAVGQHLRRSVVACLAATVTLTAIAGCTTTPSDEGNSSIVIRSFLYENWDPVNNGSINVALTTQAVYEPLIDTAAPGLGQEPVLAKSFELSDDGRTLDMVLRDDVTFTDGVHMDAAGVEKVLNEYIANPKATTTIQAVIVAQGYEPEVEATGEYTLTITTARPMGMQFFWEFGLTPIVSPEAIDDPSILAEGPVGTGPYIIKEYIPGLSVTFERNPDYWDPDRYPFDELTVVAYEDDVAALNALKSDQVDVISFIAPNVAAEAEAWGGSIFTGPGGITSLYVVAHDGDSPFADIRVRRALSEAIDREAILQNLNLGYGTASSNPTAPGHPYYYEGEEIQYDPEHAKELLAEAGYPDGFAVAIPTHPGLAAIEPIVAQYLGDIGIRVTYESFVDYTAFMTAVLPGTYPLVLFEHGPESAYVVITTDGILVPSVLDDPELASLWNESVEGATKESRDAAALAASKYILEQHWLITITAPAGIFATNGEVDVEIVGPITLPKLDKFTPAD